MIFKGLVIYLYSNLEFKPLFEAERRPMATMLPNEEFSGLRHWNIIFRKSLLGSERNA